MSQINQILRETLKNNQLDQFFYLAQDYIDQKKNADTEILNLIGFYFYKIKNFERSLYFFELALSQSNNFEVFSNKASVLIAMKKFDEAIKVYQEQISLYPKNVNGYFNISVVCNLLEDKKKSLFYLDAGLKELSNNYLLLYSKGKTYLKYRDYVLALKFLLKCEKLKSSNNKDPGLFNRIGLCYENLSKVDEAVQYYKKSLNIDEYYLDTLYNLANLYRSLGKFKSSLKLYETIKKKYPLEITVYRYLSIIHKFKKNDNFFNELLKVSITADLKKNEKKYELFFALAKAYEDINDYENSTKFLLLGNKHKKKTLNRYGKEVAEKHFDIQKRIFNNIQFDKFKTIPLKSPIFIIGMPRSGTTLVEQIISSHSTVNSGGELTFLSDVIKEFYPEKNLETFLKDVQNTLYDKYKLMADSYLSKSDYLTKNFDLFTDKLPNNFMFVGFIKSIFPNSKIIYCLRDQNDNSLSIFKNYFHDEGIWFAYDPKDIKFFYNLHKRYMDFWFSLFSNQIFTVYYEKLVNSQLEETKKLLNYCNLSFEENCINFYNNKSQINTLSTAQVRQPMYKDSLGKFTYYKKYIPDLFD